MAIYHLSVQVIGRASGRSATGAAAYRAGEVIVEQRTGEVHDYTRKQGVLHSEILAPKDAPDWALDRAELWNRVELAEKRKDAQVCRELNIALPHELTNQQRLNLIHGYVRRNFVRHGMVADVCLHAPGKGEDNQNFHAHIMLTMRPIEGDGFGKKARDWNAVGMLESWRKSWADMANEALAEAGHDARIDHRSNEARGLVEVPGQHHGPAVAGLLRRGEESEVAQRQAAERAARESAQLEAQMAIARAQAAAADAELQGLEAQEAARAARAAQEAQEAAKEAAKAAQAVEAERQRLDGLAHARQAHQKAERALVQAVQAEGAAETAVEQLQNARDWAILGQGEAGQSLLKSAQAAFKAPGWARAINAYDRALDALRVATRVVQAARQAVAQAWHRVLGLDPAERAKQAVRLAAWQAQQAPQAATARVAPAPAPQRAPRPAQAPPAPRQVYQAHEDDDDEPRPGPGPGM